MAIGDFGQKWNSPWACVAVTGLVFFVFVMARLAAHDFDPSTFVVAGDRTCDPARVPSSLTVQPDSWSYDGLSYYSFALSPFTPGKPVFGLAGDAYRYQRILYPLIVWPFRLGTSTPYRRC